ncbi:hypothetical protein AB9F42_34470, partial [Rhizobium leguminosarum]|uniref:hypothetical protein n=1 Tax=Rhizobium leguminosarum TaxID=384 RepID=UPI003F94E85E
RIGKQPPPHLGDLVDELRHRDREVFCVARQRVYLRAFGGERVALLGDDTLLRRTEISVSVLDDAGSAFVHEAREFLQAL